MARAIDADALHKKFFKEFDHNCRLVNKQNVARAWQGAMQLLYDAPTIDPMKQEWISVKDRLPEEKVKVLVVLGSNIRGKRICIDQRISGNWRGLGRLVTHWMPLPEPPERDGE